MDEEEESWEDVRQAALAALGTPDRPPPEPSLAVAADWTPRKRDWSRLLTVRRVDRDSHLMFTADGWDALHEMLDSPGKRFFCSARYRVWSAEGKRLAEISISQDGAWAMYKRQIGQ